VAEVLKAIEMSESEENSDSEAQIGGGRASVESVSEFLKEFKSARMSFEPLDTWLFVKACDDSGNGTGTEAASASDTNNISVSSESDSSVVYHFDSDEVSSSSSDDDDDSVAYGAASSCTVDVSDKENTLIVKNLANSPGRSGCGLKVFTEADQTDIREDDDCAFSDASSDYTVSSSNNIDSVQKCITDSHQPAWSSCFNVDAESEVCSFDAYEVCSDSAPVTADREKIMYRSSKCCKDINIAGDVLDKFKLTSEKSTEFAIDTTSVICTHVNQRPVSIESPARAVCDDSAAECNVDIDSNGDIDDTLKRKKKRQRIAQELMDTEATYQRHLELIVEV